MLQIAEHTARAEKPEDFAIQGLFALVRQVMNGKARNHRVKRPELRERLVQIVFAYLDTMVAREAPARSEQHRRRKVDGHPGGTREASENQGKQSAIAAAEIENPRSAGREGVEQHAFTFRAVRNFIRDREVAGR